MKIAGIDLNGPNVTIIPVIRGEETIIFQANCIADMDEFDLICPEPTPPSKIRKGEKISIPLLNDPKYLEKMDKYSGQKIDWLVAKSLLATEGLTWESVDFTNPETFILYRKELTDSGFSAYQILQLIKGVMDAHGLNEERIQEARTRFLVTRSEGQQNESSPMAAH